MKKFLIVIITIISTLLVLWLSFLIYIQVNKKYISITDSYFYYKSIVSDDIDDMGNRKKLSIKDTIKFYEKYEIDLRDYKGEYRLMDDFESIEINLDKEYLSISTAYYLDKEWKLDGYIGKLIKIKNYDLYDMKINYDPTYLSLEIIPGNIEKENDFFRTNYLNSFEWFFPSFIPDLWCVYIFDKILYQASKYQYDYLSENCHKATKYTNDSKILWSNNDEVYYYLFISPNQYRTKTPENSKITIDLIDSSRILYNLNNNISI